VSDHIGQASLSAFSLSVPASITFGSTGTATVSGDLGTGAVKFSATGGGCSVNSSTGVITVTNASLTCDITATKAGDANYTSASAGPMTVQLVKAPSTTVVTFGGGPFPYKGSAYTATATVTGVGGLNSPVTPVNYSGDCVNVTVTNGCTASATYTGDANHEGSSDSKSITIAKAAVTATAGSGAAAYDGLTHSPSACTVSGAYKGDLTCTNSPASVGPAAGTSTITPILSGTGLDNFAITLVNGSYTIALSTGKAITGAHTMGFWQNKNGQGIIRGQSAAPATECPSATWLKQFAPFQDMAVSPGKKSPSPAVMTCSAVATWVTKVMGDADASGATMNAMLKGQMLSTALSVYFSDPALGGNQIGAPVAIGGVKIDVTGSCGGYKDASSAFGGAVSLTVSQILSYAASQSNVGGSNWYGQVKATQGLAKDLFDAINNRRACAGW
jgi:hypothetical protein